MGFIKDAWNGITGKTAANAAGAAGQLQSDAAKQAGQISQNQYNQTRNDLMPWMGAGQNALAGLQDHLYKSKSYSDPYGQTLQNSIMGRAPTEAEIAAGADPNSRIGGLNLEGNVQTNGINASSVGNHGNLSANTFDDSTRANMQGNYDGGKYTGGLSLEDFQADPSYEFRKQQGMDGIQGSAAAGGSLLSGAALKSLNSNNSNLASQEYNNAWQRDQAQKQQQFGVDSGIRNQDFGIFADNENRQFAVNSTNAGFAQQADQTNASLQQQAAIHNSNAAQQAQNANQNYGLNALSSIMGARAQDYGMFDDDYARQYNGLAGLAGMGRNAASGVGAFGAQNAMNQASALTGGANAQGNALTTGAAARTQGFQNLLGLGMKAGGMFI